jgi:hypothetical protein
MLHYLWKRLTRELVLLGAFFLPPERRRALERRLRGREEFRRLGQADVVVVSFGKSGRTWLRVLLSRFFQIRYGLKDSSLLGFDNLNRRDARIPRVFFTHDNYLRDYTGNVDNRRDFYDKRTVLLVRHPADVAVSQYFQWKFRMRPGKKTLNEYPEHGAEVDVFGFVTSEAGLPKVIEFMNAWARELPRVKDLAVVSYEGLRADTAGELGRTLRFMGQEPTGLSWRTAWPSRASRTCASWRRRRSSGSPAAGCGRRTPRTRTPTRCAARRSAATATTSTTPRPPRSTSWSRSGCCPASATSPASAGSRPNRQRRPRPAPERTARRPPGRGMTTARLGFMSSAVGSGTPVLATGAFAP